jgi:hypothetical protein
MLDNLYIGATSMQEAMMQVAMQIYDDARSML